MIVPPANTVPANVMPLASIQMLAAIPPATIRNAKIMQRILTNSVPVSSRWASRTRSRLNSWRACCSCAVRSITQSIKSGRTSCSRAISSAAGNMESSTTMRCSITACPPLPIWALLCWATLAIVFLKGQIVFYRNQWRYTSRPPASASLCSDATCRHRHSQNLYCQTNRQSVLNQRSPSDTRHPVAESVI